MNIYELNKLIIQLESENKHTNNELIEFYKVKRIELIGQINSELKKNINKFFKEVKWLELYISHYALDWLYSVY